MRRAAFAQLETATSAVDDRLHHTTAVIRSPNPTLSEIHRGLQDRWKTPSPVIDPPVPQDETLLSARNPNEESSWQRCAVTWDLVGVKDG
ncbi:uncharacterized protein ATNIH1004_008515 [Aspergillus tanneri]|uniref:Uncharacterized protein n=1 Tax=Aspergillus tanneri TaxID=1220188 RepID=A0A5M9MG51_9EURO|nr:uncharacterized protein ATNIH1004_008515 [Aspergillus tanneri]KAA8644314.1 hypothetical protein ATNIH1004_008515 [Aspergillus tanneri]